ncbi:MAG: helix-turn-helix transcriptional regulator [Ruminococcus sp.]|jgi:transcriptional regulator with XRE-family HTH domain|nr:helix-turn-helix transcriptional regulator [Ruminococcus sp.]
MKNNIKAAREKQGLTQQECADLFDVKLRAWQTYEQGVSEPKFEVLCKIADVFGVTTDYLLGREPAPDPFADLNLNKESETNVIDKYMSLPPNIRACLMDVLLQLADAAKQRQNAPSKDDTQCSKLSISTTLGTIEDEIEKMAMSKGGA